MSLKKIVETEYSVPTRLIYGKSPSEQWDYSHHVIPPVTASSAFRLDSTKRGAQGFEAFAHHCKSPIYIYDRLGEPNNDMLQDALVTAEQGEAAITFSSGMAAVHAAVCFSLSKGSEVIAHKTLYGCTFSLFQNWLTSFGFSVTFADLTDASVLRSLVTAATKVVYLESPANPTLDLIDLDEIVAIVRSLNDKRAENQRIITVIDNTFATPYCQRPMNHGIDCVVHSLTKGIGGFGTDMGGAIITREEFQDRLLLFRKDFGCNLAPQTAWHILTYGISTLPLRLPQQQRNALRVAKFLENHKAVKSVSYPGLESFSKYALAQKLLRNYDGEFSPGTMIYFTLNGSSPEACLLAARRMMDHLADNAYCVTLAVSLGQLRTLVEHPSSMTHSSYSAEEQVRRGIDPGGIRLAIGIERAEDILKDISSALDVL